MTAPAATGAIRLFSVTALAVSRDTSLLMLISVLLGKQRMRGGVFKTFARTFGEMIV